MSHLRTVLVVLAAALGSACADTPTIVQDPSAAVRVINASGMPLDILIDGVVTTPALGVANVSSNAGVRAGPHVVGVRSPTGTVANISVHAADNATVTMVVVPDTASRVALSVLLDTGNVVPAGKSKLRVAHLANGGRAIEFWRTQPDFQTPVHILTPFVYGATSPYLQSDPGHWEVFVTAPGGGVKLATTGAVNVPSGERRTVVLLDSAGTLRFRVIAE
ncbi:MAG: hypothetical protein JWL61_3395 [Gemmatimonadetes bacterium]|nr:hypothetical protein [Gemmatimonadota bacterium]